MTLARRDFLSAMGLGAGTWLLAPIFSRRLLPEAMGAVTPGRKRFILMTHGGGLLEEHYTCPARSETDFDLGPVLKPFEPFRKQLLVLSKFFCPIDKRQHGNQYAVLSMMKSPNQDYGNYKGLPPGGVSVDRFLARQIGAQDAFDSTLVGIDEQKGNPVNLSAEGLNKPYPAIGSPLKAYDTYFARQMTGADDPMATAKLIAEERSVLDLIRGDIARMNARLAGPGRAKLDQYLDALRGVERRLMDLGGTGARCQPPPRPAELMERSSLDPSVIAAHIQVTYAAHLCGLTRVSHISIHGFSSPHTPYRWLGDTQGLHVCMHERFMGSIVRIGTYVSSQVARMAELLAKTPEGDGTMLDNSLLVFVNVGGGTHHNGHNNYSVISLGKAGGTVRTGRYVAYPQGRHSLGDVWTGVVNALGVPVKAFGDPAYVKEPLPAFVGG